MMKLSELTLANLKAMKPRPEVWAFAKTCGGDMQRFWDTCPNGDWLLWLLRKTGNLSELEARKVALAYALKVLPVFEKNAPDDNRPRLCLKAVKAYLKNPTTQNQAAMLAAAAAAHSAYVTYAAAASAYYAASYPSGSASADYAVHFATAAIDVVIANHSFCSGFDPGARTQFERWGAKMVRAIVQRTRAKSKRARARTKS